MSNIKLVFLYTFIVLMVFKVSRNLPMLAWIKWPVPVDYNFSSISLFTLFFLMSVTLSKQSHDPPVENQWIGLNRDTEKCEAWIKRKREDRESISLFLSLCVSLSLSFSLSVCVRKRRAPTVWPFASSSLTVMTSSAAGRSGCSANIPERLWSLADVSPGTYCTQTRN